MSVTINGTVCHNCWDVDWAKKVEREQIEKHQAETRKAQEAVTAPPGSSPDSSRRPDQTFGFAGPATILDDALKGAATSDGVLAVGNPVAIALATSSGPGRTINIIA